MKRYLLIFISFLLSCGGGDDETGDGMNGDSADLNTFLSDNVIVPSEAVLVSSTEVVFSDEAILVEVDTTDAFETKILKGVGAAVRLELLSPNPDITHAGIQFETTDDIWIIPLNESADLPEGVVEYSIERPALLCTSFDENCLITTADQYAVTESNPGEFTLSRPVKVNVAAICGDCVDPSCGGLGNACFANEDSPNPSTVTFRDITYKGGTTQCNENNLGLRDYSLGNGAVGITIINGAESGRFDLTFPDFLNDFSLPQRMWINVVDAQNPDGFLGVSGTITFSANRATFNVIVEDTNTVFDADADHAANRVAISGVISCNN